MPRWRIIVFAIALSVLTLCGACTSVSDYTLTKRSEIDKAIATARLDTQFRLETLSKQQADTLKQTVDAHVAREQRAADLLFKGMIVGSGLKSPTRPEMVMNQSIQQTATQLPPASPAAQAKTLEDLRTELDETKISAEALRKQYEEELRVARAEGEAKAKAIKELGEQVAAVEAERVAVLSKAAQIERDLQVEKDRVQDAQLTKAKEEEARAKSMQATKTKFSAITGALTLACIAGAIWSPVGKSKFGLGAIVFGLATAAIWYIQPIHIAVAIGVGVLALVLWGTRNHWIESRAATNTYRAIQSIKTESKEDYDRIVKPKLAEWQTVYTAKGTAPDQAAVKLIDDRLKETGDL